jgi:hypothetical protein
MFISLELLVLSDVHTGFVDSAVVFADDIE